MIQKLVQLSLKSRQLSNNIVFQASHKSHKKSKQRQQNFNNQQQVPETAVEEVQQEQQEPQLTKKEQRKLQEKQSLEEINNLATVAEQRELTEEKLKDIVHQRKKQVLEISKQTKIPNDALITSALLTAPILLSPVLLNYMCFSGIMLDVVPRYSIMFAKYTALHLSFGAGIHWAFAMSLHDMQFDSVRSSWQAKQHFLLSVLPVISSISMMNTLCYSPQAPTELKVISVGILAGLYCYNLFLDRKVVNAQQAPKWFFNLKLAMTAASLCGMGAFAYLHFEFSDKVVDKNHDPLRQHIPNKEELLKSSLKLTEQEQALKLEQKK